MQNMEKALKINRLKKPLTVRFFKKLADNCLGFAHGDHQGVQIEISRDQSYKAMMVALAHEMVHAKQYLRKELTWDLRWKNSKRRYDLSDYENQPWEKEAMKLEYKLFDQCWPEEILPVAQLDRA